MKEYLVRVYGNRTEWRNPETKELHREDGPAVESCDGYKARYREGKLHREDGPAAEYPDGSKEWSRNGKLHREDGPAAEWSDGSKSWWRNGELHRDDGPAIVNDEGYKAWWVDGKRMSEEEFNRRVLRTLKVGSQTFELTLEQIEQLRKVLKEVEG